MKCPRRENDKIAAGVRMLSYEHQYDSGAAVTDTDGVTVVQDRGGLGIADLDNVSRTATF